MADSPSAQLTLFHRMAPPEEMRRFARALDDVGRRLALAGAEVARLAAEIAIDEEREGARRALLEALNGLALVGPTRGASSPGPKGGGRRAGESRRR